MNTFATRLKRPRPWQTSVPLRVRCSVLDFAVAIIRHLEPILSQHLLGHLRPGVRCAVCVSTSGCSPIVLVLLRVGDDWAVDRELVRDGPEARCKAVSPSGSRNGAGRGRRKMTARGRGSSCFAVTFATLTVVAGKGCVVAKGHDAARCKCRPSSGHGQETATAFLSSHSGEYSIRPAHSKPLGIAPPHFIPRPKIYDDLAYAQDFPLVQRSVW